MLSPSPQLSLFCKFLRFAVNVWCLDFQGTCFEPFLPTSLYFYGGEKSFPAWKENGRSLLGRFLLRPLSKIDLKSAGAGAASAISKKNSKTSPSQSCIGQSEKSPWDRRTEIRVLVLVYCPYSISWPLYVLTFNSDRKVSSRLVPLPFLQTEPSTVGTWWAASGDSALSACICSGCPILREMMTHGCLRL